MRSLPNICPLVKFRNLGNVSCFSWEKKEENLEKSCSIRAALDSASIKMLDTAFKVLVLASLRELSQAGGVIGYRRDGSRTKTKQFRKTYNCATRRSSLVGPRRYGLRRSSSGSDMAELLHSCQVYWDFLSERSKCARTCVKQAYCNRVKVCSAMTGMLRYDYMLLRVQQYGPSGLYEVVRQVACAAVVWQPAGGGCVLRHSFRWRYIFSFSPGVAGLPEFCVTHVMRNEMHCIGTQVRCVARLCLKALHRPSTVLPPELYYTAHRVDASPGMVMVPAAHELHQGQNSQGHP